MNIDEEGWPPPVGDPTTAADAEYAAKLEVRKARTAESIALSKSYVDADIANIKDVYNALGTVATTSIDRSRANADAVQKAAAAIVVLYTGVLGVAFSVSERPLPLRGVLPALFLGTAIVLATAYLSYLSPKTASVPAPLERPGLETQARERLKSVVAFVRATTQPRLRLLRSSVVALGVGLLFLPIAFISVPGGSTPDDSQTVTTNWPSTKKLPSGKLGEIKYQAQVKEAAAKRQSESAPAPEDDLALVFVAIIAGAVAVAFVPTIGETT